MTASSSVILIFILSVLSETFSVNGTGVGGTSVAVLVDVGSTAVGVTVGGGLVGAETITIGVGDTMVGGKVDVGADPQAATRTAATMSMIICWRVLTTSLLCDKRALSDGQDYLRYCSSLTCSSHSTALPSRASWMAM
jgi:hypothetical protein